MTRAARRRWPSAGAAWLCLACALPAAAEEHASVERHDSRLFVGEEVGMQGASALWIDGRRVKSEGGDFYFGLDAGYVHALSQALGVLVLSRVGFWATDWTSLRGENRYRVDLAVGPELRWSERPRRPRTGWHASAPLGLSYGHSTTGPGRGVQDAYGAAYGLNAGATLGFDLSGLHHGAYFDASWVTHLTWMSHSATLVATGAHVEDEYRFLDHTLMFVAGYLYRL